MEGGRTVVGSCERKWMGEGIRLRMEIAESLAEILDSL